MQFILYKRNCLKCGKEFNQFKPFGTIIVDEKYCAECSTKFNKPNLKDYNSINTTLVNPSNIKKRYCDACEEDITDQPLDHKLCYTCWKKGRRSCEKCSKDITYLPETYKLCKDCWSITRYSTSKYRCNICGTDMSKNRQYKICYSCWRKGHRNHSNYLTHHDNSDDNRPSKYDGYDDEWGYYNIHGDFPE